jgi:hypothetical protein
MKLGIVLCLFGNETLKETSDFGQPHQTELSQDDQTAHKISLTD